MSLRQSAARDVCIVTLSLGLAFRFFFLRSAAFLGGSGSRRRWTRRLGMFIGSHRHIAQDPISQFEISLQFLNRLSGALVVKQGVVTFALFIDAIGKIPQTPLFYVNRAAALSFDYFLKSLDELFYARSSFRMDHHHSFILSHD